MKQAILKLKQDIKAQVETAKALRNRIRETKGDERHQAWNRKRAHGSGTRYMLLAYGCLRGVPYARIEQKTHEPPYYGAIRSEIKAVLPPDSPEIELWTNDRVKAWLEGKEAPRAKEAAA
jgi:hypothetical protein